MGRRHGNRRSTRTAAARIGVWLLLGAWLLLGGGPALAGGGDPLVTPPKKRPRPKKQPVARLVFKPLITALAVRGKLKRRQRQLRTVLRRVAVGGLRSCLMTHKLKQVTLWLRLRVNARGMMRTRVRKAVPKHRGFLRCARKALRGLRLGSRAPGRATATLKMHKTRVLGAEARGALGGLIGSHGVGGLGLRGSGRGGGVGSGTIGLGALGKLGNRRRTPHRSKYPVVRGGRAVVRGALAKPIIRRIVRRHINELRYCAAREKPPAKGRIVLQWTIAASGRVLLSRARKSTLKPKRATRCMVAAVKRWRFPRPKGGGIVIVAYPLVFR